MKASMLPLPLVTVLAVPFALGTVLRAQGPSPPPRGARPDAVQSEMQRQFEMQAIEKALSAGRTRQVQRYAPVVLDQIRNDFLRIQVIDRKLALAASVPATLDLKLVVRSVAEIRKRSGRLKGNLALPNPEIKLVDRSMIAVEPKTESLRSSLSILSRLIEDFVSNPMFEKSRLIDPQLSAKALQDIEAIIELSSEIKRSGEKLKAAEKSP